MRLLAIPFAQLPEEQRLTEYNRLVNTCWLGDVHGPWKHWKKHLTEVGSPLIGRAVQLKTVHIWFGVRASVQRSCWGDEKRILSLLSWLDLLWTFCMKLNGRMHNLSYPYNRTYWNLMVISIIGSSLNSKLLRMHPYISFCTHQYKFCPTHHHSMLMQ